MNTVLPNHKTKIVATIWPESELKSRVEAIQERTQNMRNLAMDALVELIGELKTANASNAPAEQIAAAQDFQRKAQFYLDFVEAETPRASTRRRKRSESSANPSTLLARDNSRCGR